MPTSKETRKRPTRDPVPPPSIVDVDPEDPAQALDEAGQFSVVDIELDAQPHAEADAELDAAVATTAEDYSDSMDTTDVGDAGDLYGVHVPRAADADSDLTQDREALEGAERGEHVFESLEKKMAENGTQDPEEDVEFEDDSDPEGGHHKTDMRDRPIADKGSGGPAGL